MSTRVAVIWDSPLLFTRIVEECGHTCELVTPHLLAAPFFRKQFHGIIIPAGFASPGHTTILTALRAIRSRIKRYAEEGGTILAFGAGYECTDAYDWLPVDVRYSFGFSQSPLMRDRSHPSSAIIGDDQDILSYDGILEGCGGQVILTAPQGPVMLSFSYRNGRITVISLHEYPSQRFISEFCRGGGEGLL
ncbi:MAG: hypothetical protein LUQ07_02225 [Methanospirillum sp.]|nr:hypothetical protein [Methanospirillum sp.]